MKISELTDFLETSSIVKKDDVSLVVLGGSRGCGFEAEDSDYDLNFYFRDQPKKWECCMNTYGFVKMGKYTVHWYSHPRDLALVNVFPEVFYYAKLPLLKQECFLSCDDIGGEYQKFLLTNADYISLCFLKKLFNHLEFDDKCIISDEPSFSFKWCYGIMLLANYFKVSNYSEEEILECKTEKNLPIKTKEGLSGIVNLKNFVEQQHFDSSFLLGENRKWKQ